NVPGERVRPVRPHPLAHDRDGPFAGSIDEGETPTLPGRPEDGLHAHAERAEVSAGPVTDRIVPERGEEGALPGPLGELPRGHRPATSGLLPGFQRVDDLPGERDALDTGELDPLHMTHHGHPHRSPSAHRTPAKISRTAEVLSGSRRVGCAGDAMPGVRIEAGPGP